ncbi:MAG: hypothetical protein EOM10_17440, partial [Opitutae bacterium]|nr:hypothetical protein [Opitutae bacterium]
MKRVLGSVAVRGWVAGALAGLAAGTVCEGAETAGGTGIIPVTIGLHAAEGETAGMGDVWIPLVRRDGGVLFLNPRASVNDRDEEEINLGLGVRRLVEGALPCIVGANVYYDGRWTRNGNRFDQLGLGVEFLSDRVDARANYYLPDRDTALVDVVETETVTETRRLRQDVETIWGDPYGAAHDIRQDYVTRLTLRETVLRETLTQVYENREAALEGWDAEIGLKTDQAARRDLVVQAHPALAVRDHVLEFAAALAECLHDRALRGLLHVDRQLLVWLADLSVDLAEDDLGARDGQLVALAAHGLEQDRQM